jgi:biopolymer transport protein ExbB/TolQ
LATAIPAVVAYNLLSHSIREFAARSDDFAMEFLNTVESTQSSSQAQQRVGAHD